MSGFFIAQKKKVKYTKVEGRCEKIIIRKDKIRYVVICSNWFIRI